MYCTLYNTRNEVAKKTGFVFMEILQAIRLWSADFVIENIKKKKWQFHFIYEILFRCMKMRSAWTVQSVQWLVAGRRRNWRNLPPDRSRYFVCGAQLGHGDLFLNGKAAGKWIWTSHSCSSDVKNKRIYTSTSVYGFKTSFLIKYQIYLDTDLLSINIHVVFSVQSKFKCFLL